DRLLDSFDDVGARWARNQQETESSLFGGGSQSTQEVEGVGIGEGVPEALFQNQTQGAGLSSPQTAGGGVRAGVTEAPRRLEDALPQLVGEFVRLGECVRDGGAGDAELVGDGLEGDTSHP